MLSDYSLARAGRAALAIAGMSCTSKVKGALAIWQQMTLPSGA